MNNRISNITKYLRLDILKNDRRIFVFSVCLLIAITLWFLDALSKNYSTTLTYNVRYVNPPENLFMANNPPSKLDLRVNAHGFTLLRHKLAFSFSPILLDLTAFSQDMDTIQNRVLVTSESIIRGIDNQISNEITVSDVSPRIFTIKFDTLNTKMVRIVPDIYLNFKPQFNLNGNIELDPDSIEISGPAGIIDTITGLTTVPVTFNDLETRIEQAIRIAHPDKTSVYPGRVTLYVPVEKFTEKRITLPLQIVNVPEDIQIKLFPPQVTISFMVGLSSYANISGADFVATVDFNKISADKETLEVQVESTASFIHQIKSLPASVEFLVEAK